MFNPPLNFVPHASCRKVTHIIKHKPPTTLQRQWLEATSSEWFARRFAHHSRTYENALQGEVSTVFQKLHVAEASNFWFDDQPIVSFVLI